MFSPITPKSKLQALLPKGSQRVTDRGSICVKLNFLSGELSYFEDLLQSYAYAPYNKVLFEKQFECLQRIRVLREELRGLTRRFRNLDYQYSIFVRLEPEAELEAQFAVMQLFTDMLRFARKVKLLKKEVRQYWETLMQYKSQFNPSNE